MIMVKCHESKCKLYTPSEGVDTTIHVLEIDGHIADPEEEITKDRTSITEEPIAKKL